MKNSKVKLINKQEKIVSYIDIKNLPRQKMIEFLSLGYRFE